MMRSWTSRWESLSGSAGFQAGRWFYLMNPERWLKWGSIMLIGLWLILFALIPHLLILLNSFLAQDTHQVSIGALTFTHYKAVFNTVYLRIFWQSFILASVCTGICLALGYPFAWILAQLKSRHKRFFLFPAELCRIVPFSFRPSCFPMACSILRGRYSFSPGKPRWGLLCR